MAPPTAMKLVVITPFGGYHLLQLCGGLQEDMRMAENIKANPSPAGTCTWHGSYQGVGVSH